MAVGTLVGDIAACCSFEGDSAAGCFDGKVAAGVIVNGDGATIGCCCCVGAGLEASSAEEDSSSAATPLPPPPPELLANTAALTRAAIFASTPPEAVADAAAAATEGVKAEVRTIYSEMRPSTT